ncbi:MAG TPA: ATP-binding protein, partial [Candidatus Paceibacterota bacterium]|nr:ATP-binding protein [Candidatus Paceibacterota bacterium]
FTPASGLPGSAIRSVFSDENDIQWIGTAGGGLVVRVDQKFVRITSEQGLPANAIFQILLDDRGRMWFGSPAGIFHVSREELLACAYGQVDRVHAVIFGRSDGVASVSCLGGFQPAAWKSSRGQLWFATRQGLLKVDTAAERINRRPPPVLLNECLVNGKPVGLGRILKIPPAARKLEFNFSVLSFTAPEKVQVRHWLKGFDSDWVEAGPQRSVAYPKLPPGRYELRVAACNNDGVWNDNGLDLMFIVQPAWWQSATFRIAALIAFAAIVGLSVRYWSHRRLRLKLERLEQQQALEKERARIARDLHDDLGVSLTQIALLAEMSSDASVPAERLKKNLGQIVLGARYLVRELDGILWTVNPKNDSLDKLASYLCQFAQQFFRLTPICCRFDVGDDIPAYPLTPEIRHDLFLIVKEALNNVVKHSGAREVWLRLHLRDGAFLVKIEDDGRGLSPDELQNSDRNGMRNMRARMAGIGGTFDVQSEPGRGTSIRISFPLKPAA